MCPSLTDTTFEINRPVVSIIGRANHSETRAVFEWLSERIGPDVRSCLVYESVSDQLQSSIDAIPDLIVVWQYWPDEYSRREVNQLLAFAPLARVVVCCGAWCESDGRNREIWPLAVRVPIWSAESRLEREWQLILGTHDRSPLLWSASREEVFAFDTSPVSLPHPPQEIMLDSPDAAYRRFLSEMLLAEGYSLVNNSPSLILFDADPWGETRLQVLKTIRTNWPLAEVCVLSNEANPRWAHELREAGVAQLHHKLGFRRQR